METIGKRGMQCNDLEGTTTQEDEKDDALSLATLQNLRSERRCRYAVAANEPRKWFRYPPPSL